MTQETKSVKCSYSSRNVKCNDLLYLFYLIYIKYVHVNVNMRWHSRDNQYAGETYMKILLDIQELIWMSFLPLMESHIYKLSANPVNPSTFAVSGSTINSDINWQYLTSLQENVQTSQHMYQAELPGSLKLHQLISLNQAQT